jgi:hypothetical protein
MFTAQIHPRIAFVAELLGLIPNAAIGPDVLTRTVCARLHVALGRLAHELPTLTAVQLQEILARCCRMPNWDWSRHKLMRPVSYEREFLSNGELRTVNQSGKRSTVLTAWSVEEAFPALLDVSTLPPHLTDIQRLFATRFALALAERLPADSATAFDLTARLYGAKDWPGSTAR